MRVGVRPHPPPGWPSASPLSCSELARFISAGRLHAKIDKVGGVLETNRADAKNAQYLEMVEKGDSLLNRVQTLARTINARQG